MDQSNIVLGLRIGSQKTVAVANDGELLFTETGGVSWPTLIAFSKHTDVVNFVL